MIGDLHFPRLAAIAAAPHRMTERELAPEHKRIQFTCAPENCTTLAHLSVSAAIVPP